MHRTREIFRKGWGKGKIKVEQHKKMFIFYGTLETMAA